MSLLKLHILHHPEPHVLASMPPNSDIIWDRSGSVLFSVTYTSTETSVICAESAVPKGVTTEGPFHVFEVAGPLDFALAGVLASIIDPLAARGITVITTSTYETDWILVRVDRAEEAEQIWRREGFLVTPPHLGEGS
ncbi:MAG: ACT domain-containing protein [Actinomycetales bacterium]|nr:ACT domain-containing protein [Tetrasphaera sp.]NLX00453.1 ACT domain-containing protein [Actinomycetales bacterium]